MKQRTHPIPTVCLGLLVLATILATAGPSPAQDCPTPPNRVDVEVTAEVDFDPDSELFTYRYEVFNRPSSLQDVRRFALDFESPIEQVASPPGWKESFFDERTTIHWYAFENAPRPPGSPDTGRVLPGIAQVPPGGELDGFVFRSPNPPGPVSFYVLGFVDTTPAASEGEAERILEECPEIAGTFFDLAVSGTTRGPVDVLLVDIDIKPGSSPNSIQPESRGVIPVAVLATPDFDPSEIDGSTVRFGPAEAAPVHGTPHFEDIDSDGDVDRVFHFSTQESGLTCADETADLTGATRGGTPILGTDSVRTVGRCGP